MSKKLNYDLIWDIEDFTTRRDDRYSEKFWPFEGSDPVFDPSEKVYNPSCIVCCKSEGNYTEKEVSEFYLKFDGALPEDFTVECFSVFSCEVGSVCYGFFGNLNVKDNEVFLFSVITEGTTFSVDECVREYSREHDHIEIKFHFGMYFGDSVKHQRQTVKDRPVATNDPPKRRCNLCSDFKNLYYSKEMSDVTIIVDNVSLLAHKFVLVNRSPVFKAMMSNDCLESKTKTIYIKVADASVFDNFLKYLYCCEIDDKSYDMVLNLYLLADMYAVHGLKEDCRDILVAELNEGTVCQLLEMSHLLKDKTLKKKAVEFVKQHFSAVSKKPEWIKICKDHPEMASHDSRMFTLFHCRSK